MKASESKPSKGIEALARMGYTAKGVVYALVGVLAAMAGFGVGGRTTGTKGAISQLASQSYGQVLLILMVLGLAGYVVWRFTQAFADPEHKGSGFKGLATRAGLLISGVIYGGLAAYAATLLVSSGGGGGGSSAQGRTATVMAYEGGILLVGAVGIAFIAVGVYQAYRGYAQTFKKSWNMGAMSAGQRRWAVRLARIGLFARAVVFAIIGGFLIIAAMQADPSKARGLGGALDTLARQPYGPWLLCAVGLGLACYGVYCFVNARYRHIDPEVGY